MQELGRINLDIYGGRTMTTITSVDITNPAPGQMVTFELADANATGKSVSCASGFCQLAGQSATHIAFFVPELHEFGTRSVNYGVAAAFTVHDGAESDSENLSVQPASGDFWGEVLALTGVNSSGCSVGNFRYAQWASGGGSVDLTNGAVTPTDEAELHVWTYNGSSWTDNPAVFNFVPPLDDAVVRFSNLPVPPLLNAGSPIIDTSPAGRGGDRT